MIKKYKQFKESLLNKLQGPTKEEVLKIFFENEISKYKIVELLKSNIITFDDVAKKYHNDGNKILDIINEGNFYNIISYDKMIEYGITPDNILRDSLFSGQDKKDIQRIDGFLYAMKNGAKLEKIQRYRIVKLLEGDNEILIETMLKYFIDKKIYQCLLSWKANENIVNNHPNLIQIREKYMEMCNDYNKELVNTYQDFFNTLPMTPEDFMKMIIDNIEIVKNVTNILYYYGNNILFFNPNYLDNYVYIRKIIEDILSNYYKLNNTEIFIILKNYVIDVYPIKSNPILWDEKMFRMYDKKI